MKITFALIITYILNCIRIGTKPCKYFQLNSPWFDREKGLFSKLAIDESIPAEWRLEQTYEDTGNVPESWPVFVKPEWGQNAAGIQRANNEHELNRIRRSITASNVRYLVQQGAPEKREFEVFALRHHLDRHRFAVFSVTEAVNDAESNPINGVYNPNTRYRDITDHFGPEQCNQLWKMINRTGEFNISRTSFRANSEKDLLAGRCHIIEINLFLPMPIHMLDPRYGWHENFAMVRRYMVCLALITRVRDKSLEEKPVFSKIMLYNRSSKFANYLRAKL